MRRGQQGMYGVKVMLRHHRTCEDLPCDWHAPSIGVPLFTNLPEGRGPIRPLAGGLDDADGSNLPPGIGEDQVVRASFGEVQVGLIPGPVSIPLRGPDVSAFKLLAVCLPMVHPPVG